MDLITEGRRKLRKLKESKSILVQLSRKYILSLNSKAEWLIFHQMVQAGKIDSSPQKTWDLSLIKKYGLKGRGIC